MKFLPIILILSLLLVSVVSAEEFKSDNGLFNVEITQKEGLPNFFSSLWNNLFVVTLSKSIFMEDEQISVTSNYPVESCSDTKVKIQLFQPDSNPLTIDLMDSVTIGFGCGRADRLCSSVTLNTNTRFNGQNAGDYLVKDTWYCGNSIMPNSFGYSNPFEKTFEVVESSTSCGNNVCDSGETNANCPLDCSSSSSSSSGGSSSGGGNAGSLKELGVSCSKDSECITNKCDDKGWFQISNVCQPTPWSEVMKLSHTREEISKMTIKDAVSIACLENDKCIPISNDYDANCIPIKQLSDDGTLNFNSGSFLDGADSVITGTAYGAALGGGLGVVACSLSLGVALGTFIVPGVDAITIANAITVCGLATATTATGAIIGGSVGYISAGSDDPLVKAIKAGDANTVGLCVSELKSESSSVLNIFKFLAFFDVDGNGKKDGTDGLIILIILILLVSFLK